MLPDARFVKRFEEIGNEDRPSVGGKGASLGELTCAGIRVPPGIVVTIAAFEKFFAAADPQNEIRREIELLSPDDLQRVSLVTNRIRNQMEVAKFPSDVEAEVAAHYQELAAAESESRDLEPVAVRSSATSEDSADASFAGLQDTYLWVRGANEVIAHVRNCWASLYAQESVVYRRKKKLPEQGLAMGVVIQRMIDSRTSGVMFTCSPTSGDPSVVVIEASWGLGSAIVSGEVTPDKFVVGKVTGEIFSRAITKKLRLHKPNFLGCGVLAEDVPAALQSAPCVSDSEIRELVEIAKRVERRYGCPQDIEWAIARNATSGEDIFLLQSRPETTWTAKETAPVATPKRKAFDHVFSLLSRGAGRK